MKQVPCDGCGKPIKDGQASITANTPATREAWHLRCCPWVPRHAEPVREDVRGDPRMHADSRSEQ
jgi:hypothetical protein